MIFRRKRPKLHTDDMIATGGPDKFSFPSGHCSRAIMTSILLINLLDVSIIANYSIILWSYLTCLSRIMLARHHLSDVFVGILLGYLFAYIVQYSFI